MKVTWVSVVSVAVVSFVASAELLGAERVFCSGQPECVPDSFAIRFGDVDERESQIHALPGEVIEAFVTIDAWSAGIQGWGYGVTHDPAELEILEATTEGTDFESLVGNFPFDGTAIAEGGPLPGFISGVILSLTDPDNTTLPLADNLVVARMRYRVLAEAATSTLIEFSEEVRRSGGSPPVSIELWRPDIYLPERLTDGEVFTVPPPSMNPGLTARWFAGRVTQPGELTFDSLGPLYFGRDSSTSEALPIRRLPPRGGGPEDYGPPLPGPEAVLFDSEGLFAELGSVLVAGRVSGTEGQIAAVFPDESVVGVFGPTSAFVDPASLCFQSGRLLFVDREGQDVLVSASPSESPQTLFTLPASPRHLAVTSDRIYTSAEDGTIRVYAADGRLLDSSFATGLGDHVPIAAGPGGLVWGEDLYVVPTAGPREGQLVRFDAAGNPLALGSGFGRVRDLAFGPDGALYASMPDVMSILRIAPAEVAFRRGDANSDGTVDISDAQYLFQYLFSGGPAPPCLDAADVEDDETLNITDGIYLLNWLILGGPPVPAPGTETPGWDPTHDDVLSCDSYSPVPPGRVADVFLGFEECPEEVPRETERFEVHATLTTENNLTGNGAEGWSFAVRVENLTLVDITTAGTLVEELVDFGFAWSRLVDPELDRGEGPQGQGAISGVVLSMTQNVTLPPEGTKRIAVLTLERAPGSGARERVYYTDGGLWSGPESPPLKNVVTIAGATQIPTLRSCHPTFLENRFDDDDWDVEVLTAGGGGRVATRQVSPGGDPGGYRRILNRVHGAPGGQSSGVTGFYMRKGAVFDPRREGRMFWLDYSESSILFWGPDDAQLTGPALLQGGKYFVAGWLLVNQPSWTAQSLSGLREEDFLLLEDPGEGPRTVYPDFSATGLPIQFGFFRWSSTEGAEHASATGIDNWAVRLHRDRPAWRGEVGGRQRVFCSGQPECAPETLAIRFGDANDRISNMRVLDGDEFDVFVTIDVWSDPIQGWSYGVAHDPEKLEILEATTEGTDVEQYVIEPRFEATGISQGGPVAGLVSVVVLSLMHPASLPLADNVVLARAKYSVLGDLDPTTPTLLEFSDDVQWDERNPATNLNLTIDGAAKLPERVTDGEVFGALAVSGRVYCDPSDPANNCPGADCLCTSDTLKIAFEDDPSSSVFRYETFAPGLAVPSVVTLDVQSDDIRSYSFGVAHNPDSLDLLEENVTIEGTAGEAAWQGGFVATPVVVGGDGRARGYTTAVVLNFVVPVVLPVDRVLLARATYTLTEDVGMAGTALTLTDDLGEPPTDIGLLVEGTDCCTEVHPYKLVDGLVRRGGGTVLGTVRTLSSSDPARALPVTGSLSEQLQALNAGPPAFEPGSWQPVQRHNQNRSASFLCADVPDPLAEPFLAAEQYLTEVDEVTLDGCGSAFYRFTFELPAVFSSPCLSGVACADDEAVVFLNGHQLSGSLTDPGCEPDPLNGELDPCYELQDAGHDGADALGRRILSGPTQDPFWTCNEEHFRAGENELVFAVAGDAGYFDPTGLEFAATLRYDGSGPLPDLAVTQISAPESAYAEETVEVTWRVTNAGPVPAAGPWLDSVRLSQEGETGTGVLLGEVAFDGVLEPGESYEVVEAVLLPEEPGDYRLNVTTDSWDALRELGEGTSNRLRDDRVIQVEPIPLPDLVVDCVEVPGECVLAGSTIEVAFCVRNQGEAATNASFWKDTVFLLEEPSLGHCPGDCAPRRSGYVWQFQNDRFLPVGEGYRQQVSIKLPEKIEGTFYLGVYTDSGSGACWRQGHTYAVRESDECNNSVLSEPFCIEITTFQPDLHVRDIVFHAGEVPFPKVVFSATRIRVTWTDENIGSGPTDVGTWDDRVYLSENDDAVIGGGDTYWGPWRRQGKRLEAGAFDDSPPVPKILPADLEGEYFIKVQTDVGNVITEYGHEGNNISVCERKLVVVLSPPPDLKPTRINVPEVTYPGHVFEVSWKVENIGGPPMDLPRTWRDGLYLSDDETPDPSELLATYARSTTRGANGELVLEDYSNESDPPSFRLPAEISAGNRYVIVVADVYNELFEGRGEDPGEHNNVLVSEVSEPVRVECKTADLVIEPGYGPGLPPPDRGAAGQPIHLAWRVTNAGDVVTPVSSWRDGVYFSEDAVLDGGDRRLLLVDRTRELRPEDSYAVGRDTRVPLIAEGDYFLLFVTDVHDHVLEDPSCLENGGEDNNVAVSAFAVTGEASDLVVTRVENPDTIQAGQSVDIAWTVENLGNLETHTNLWVDRVYVSRDTQLDFDGTDRLLGARNRGEALAAQASYPVDTSFAVPRDLKGPFHVIVYTDARESVFESGEGNNVRVSDTVLTVTEFPVPRLVVSDVTVEGEILSGQTVRVCWTVTNVGTGPTDVSRWWDCAYLSRDRFLDAARDELLGSAEHMGALGPSESYTTCHAFDVPLGVAGGWFVIVDLDCTRRVYSDPEVPPPPPPPDPPPIEVEVPLPSDLVVEVIPPEQGELGQPTRFEWRVGNEGAGPLQGRWWDSVYLSADEEWGLEDVLVGRFPSLLEEPLENNEPPVTLSGTAPIRGVTPGAYYVIVRCDVFNQIPEEDEGNNIAVSATTFPVSAIPLELVNDEKDDPDQPYTGPLRLGEERYFELETPPGETVRVTLDHSSSKVWTELYVRYEEVPTPGRFDFRFEALGLSDQEVTIPGTDEGTYYVLARATRGSVVPGEEVITVTAEVLPFSVSSVSPDHVGDAGRVTLTVRGSRFDPESELYLEPFSPFGVPAGVEHRPRRLRFVNATHLEGMFLLDGMPRGSYSVIVTRPDSDEARLVGGLTVEAAVPPILEVSPRDPPALRQGASGGSLDLVVVNRGNVDAEYVFLLQTLPEGEGREVLRVHATRGFFASVNRAGFFSQSAILRSLAPGRTATLSTTLRAGSEPSGDIPVGQAVALFSTEKFIDFQQSVGNGVRLAVLEDPALLVGGERERLVSLAQDPDAWCVEWLRSLAGAGLLDEEDADRCNVTAASVPGETLCNRPLQLGRELPVLCHEIPARLCEDWLFQLEDTGVSAAGAFAASPEAYLGLSCSADEFVSCSFCLFWPVLTPQDPNEKLGPEGVGDDKFLPIQKSISYRIHFENVREASAPAAVVKIHDPLPLELNAGKVRLGRIAFGDTVLEVPEGKFVLHERVDLTSTRGVFVDVEAGVNYSTKVLSWSFRSIEPLTGEVPLDASKGFLLPSDGTGQGTGWVEFSVEPTEPLSDVLGKIIIRNEATITFDKNPPLNTLPVAHTLDAEAPESRVDSLPAVTRDREVPLSWTYEEPEGGSGIAGVAVYALQDAFAFGDEVTPQPVVTDTLETSGTFVGEPGHVYFFYSVATDHAGNVEETPPVPDAAIVVLGEEDLFQRGDANDNGTVDISDAVRILNWLFLGQAQPSCLDAADCNDDGRADISDALCILGFLFLGSPPPPPPGPTECGLDVTEDALRHCRGPLGVCRPGG